MSADKLNEIAWDDYKGMYQIIDAGDRHSNYAGEYQWVRTFCDIIPDDIFDWISYYDMEIVYKKPKLDLSAAERIFKTWPEWKQAMAETLLRPSPRLDEDR